MITKQTWVKIIKMIIGCIGAILLADLCSLQYAYSAGIITLLTIQDTKKETLYISLKRLTIFVVMTLLSMIIFPNLGYSVRDFGILLIPYLILCFVLDMKEAIVPIAVLCTHYLSAGNCSLQVIINELLILIIGSGIGILLNLFFQDNLKTVKEKQYLLEEKMRKILNRMAFYICQSDRSRYTNACFQELDEILDEIRQEALKYKNNHFIGNHEYYYSYVKLRLAQCNILKRIYVDITRIDLIPEQAAHISEFLNQISKEFHEKNNAISLMRELEKLHLYFDKEPMPDTREEFENRAVLFHILKDIEELIQLKKDWVR